MRKIAWIPVLLLTSVIGGIADAQDLSFREIDRMESYEKDFLKTAIEQGKIQRKNADSFRDINLDGIEYGNEDDLQLFIMLIIQDVCSACSTTSSGSTVRVSYGESSGSGNQAYSLNSSDDYEAGEIEDRCENLLDDHDHERDGKDILIVDGDNEDEKIALCFDRSNN